jgi:hypothetical protein
VRGVCTVCVRRSYARGVVRFDASLAMRWYWTASVVVRWRC